MQQYGHYPYYTQPAYTQQQQPHPHPQPYPHPHHPIAGPSNGYPPFYPSPYIPQGPPPVAFNAENYTSKLQASAASRQPAHRRAKTIAVTPSHGPIKLKPALKKPNPQPPPETTQLSRQRTNSLHRVRTYESAGGRSEGFPPDETTSYHLFVSIHGYNEMRVANVSKVALKDLEDQVWSVWPPGYECQMEQYTAVARFKNDPWDLSGPNVEKVYDMIVKMFELCASRGYAFHTCFDLTTATPQLIFQPSLVDEKSRFFLAFLSDSGRRLNLIRPPEIVDYGLAQKLRALLPKDVHLDVGSADGHLRIIQFKKNNALRGKSFQPELFLAFILRILHEFGYYLDAAVPLSRRGALNIRHRKEILVFKGGIQAPI